MKVGDAVRYVDLLDKFILYLIFMFAVSAGISRGGVHLSAALLTIAVIVRYIYAPFRIKAEPGLLKAILVFFSALLLSTLFSSNIYASLDILGMSILRIVIFFSVLTFVKDEYSIEKIICLLALSLFLGSLVGIWQGLHGSVRAKSFLGIMNFGGAIALIVPILLTFGFNFSKSKFLNPYFLLTTVILSCVALLYNGTRGVMLAIAITMLLYFILAGWKNIKIASIGLVLIGVLTFVSFSNVNISNRIINITKPTTDINIVARINMWGFAFQAFADHPIIGSGLGALPAYSYDKNGTVFPIDVERKPTEHWHVHNNFIQMLAENGIIGFVAFCGFFGSILYQMIRYFKQDKFRLFAMAGCLLIVSFLVHGLSDYTFDIGTIIYTFWFLLGVIYAGFKVAGNTG